MGKFRGSREPKKTGGEITVRQFDLYNFLTKYPGGGVGNTISKSPPPRITTVKSRKAEK
jgi:hypothetical protein